MSRLVAVYFSGTGNTRWAVDRLVSRLDYESRETHSIEENIDYVSLLSSADDILVAYPIVGGNIPIIMREFLRRYRSSFWSKNLITIVTEAGFSGDGGALAYRSLDRDRVTYKASYHIVMPTNVSFGKVFTIKNGDDLKRRIEKSKRKIDAIARDMNRGVYRRVGSSRLAYLMGYHLQRKYFDRIEPELVKKFQVDSSVCVRCKRCISLCPMHNIELKDGHIVGKDNCTLCYRCLHACPTNAISLIRHEDTQYRGIDHGV